MLQLQCACLTVISFEETLTIVLLLSTAVSVNLTLKRSKDRSLETRVPHYNLTTTDTLVRSVYGCYVPLI